MRVRVPSAYFVYPRMFGGDNHFQPRPGLGFLGQNGDDGDAAASEPGVSDLTGDSSSVLPTSSEISSALTQALEQETYSSPTSGMSDSQVQALANQAQAAAVAQDSNLNLSLNQYSTGSGAPTNTAGTLTAASILAQAVAKGVTANTPPYQIAGTSLIYNPATGQIINASGATVATAMLSAGTSFLSFLPLILGGFLVVWLMENMGSRK